MFVFSRNQTLNDKKFFIFRLNRSFKHLLNLNWIYSRRFMGVFRIATNNIWILTKSLQPWSLSMKPHENTWHIDPNGSRINPSNSKFYTFLEYLWLWSENLGISASKGAVTKIVIFRPKSPLFSNFFHGEWMLE